MTKDPKNTIIVVTGGAEGIGFEIANQFLINGAKAAVILDINEKLGNEAAETLNEKHGEVKAYFIKCDVTADFDTVFEEIFNKFGSVEVLVNNAGVANYDTDLEINVNLKAVIKWSFMFWERMRRDKNGRGGTIIHISSIYGVTTVPYCPVYHATKFGVIGFSKSLGHDINFERSGVRVVTLCPGFTRTQLVMKGQKTFDDAGLLERIKKYWNKLIWQDADAVAVAAVEIFKEADSGAVWKIEGGKLEVLY